MGKIVSGVTDFIGLTDSKAGERAAAASGQAAALQAQYQQDALEYLKQQEALPSAIREAALPQLAGALGVPGYTGPDISVDQAQLVRQAQESPLYSALVGGQAAGEEAILRQAGATGGLRSGNVQAALADYSTQLQNQALLQSYDEQRGLREAEIQRQLGGLSGLAGLSSYAPQIAQGTAGIGQTLGQGITAGAQARATGSQQNISNLLGLGQLAIGGAMAFSDIRLKDNVTYQGVENGYPVYTWYWNEEAYEKHGLKGKGFGVIADDVESINPEAVVIDGEFKKVRYDVIGVNHA